MVRARSKGGFALIIAGIGVANDNSHALTAGGFDELERAWLLSCQCDHAHGTRRDQFIEFGEIGGREWHRAAVRQGRRG